MLGDLDMVVETDPAALPLGVFVRQWRQRPERRFVELLEERPPVRTPAARRPVVKLGEQGADRRIELGQREEASVPQPCQDPASDDLDADFNLGLVTWLVGPHRNNGGAVIPRHVGVGPVDHRLVKAGFGGPCFEIVADRLARDTAEISKGADMCGDPIGQLLAPYRLGVVKFEAPRTATKICTGMISPVRPSTSSPVRPAKSTNSFSPATWVWRIVGFSRPVQPRYRS
jgi:hypothetical protein